MKNCSNKNCTQINPQSLSEFNKKKRNKDGLNCWCKTCLSDWHKLRRKDKNEYVTTLQRDNKRELRTKIEEFLANYLLSNPCVECGETNILVLEFDHCRGQKLFPVCRAINGTYSMKRIKAEIAKCQVLCSNCHRKKTYIAANSWRLRFITLPNRMVCDEEEQ